MSKVGGGAIACVAVQQKHMSCDISQLFAFVLFSSLFGLIFCFKMAFVFLVLLIVLLVFIWRSISSTRSNPSAESSQALPLVPPVVPTPPSPPSVPWVHQPGLVQSQKSNLQMMETTPWIGWSWPIAAGGASTSQQAAVPATSPTPRKLDYWKASDINQRIRQRKLIRLDKKSLDAHIDYFMTQMDEMLQAGVEDDDSLFISIFLATLPDNKDWKAFKNRFEFCSWKLKYFLDKVKLRCEELLEEQAQARALFKARLRAVDIAENRCFYCHDAVDKHYAVNCKKLKDRKNRQE